MESSAGLLGNARPEGALTPSPVPCSTTGLVATSDNVGDRRTRDISRCFRGRSESEQRLAKGRPLSPGNENVRPLGRRSVAAGGRVRRVFGADPSAARVGGPERQRRPEERGSVRTRETGSDHARQQLHDETVRGEPAIPGQRSVTVVRSNGRPGPVTTRHRRAGAS